MDLVAGAKSGVAGNWNSWRKCTGNLGRKLEEEKDELWLYNMKIIDYSKDVQAFEKLDSPPTRQTKLLSFFLKITHWVSLQARLMHNQYKLFLYAQMPDKKHILRGGETLL